MADGYQRLELHIHDFADKDGAYLVNASVPSLPKEGNSRLHPDDLPREEITAAIDGMDAGALGSAESIAFGKLLFRTLFTGEVAEVYAAAQEAGTVRLQLIVDVPVAQRVPWELLHDRDGFLALSGPVSRGITTIEDAHPLEARRPLRILVIEAHPKGYDRLVSEVEIGNIVAAMDDRAEGQLVDVQMISGVTLKKLQNALREAAAEPKPRPFHVLHFIGHGRHDEADGTSVLLFEKNDQRDVQPVTPSKLLKYISLYRLKLVFLNACQSVEVSARQTAETFAASLLESGVPAVIGMQTSVYDHVAQKFAQEFYEALADNRPVDAALAHARRLVHDLDPDQASNLAVPVCYLRNQSGRILELVPAESGRPTQRWWKRTYAVIAVIATLLGLFLGIRELVVPWLQGPGDMNPLNFNVAVAEIEAGTGVDASIAEGLSERIFNQINAEMATIGFTDVWPPDKAGPIAGSTPDARAANAEKLADEVNADVILYGTLTGDGEIAEFQPEFFLNERRLGGATELIGAYRYGQAERFVVTSLSAVDELEARLAARAAALAQFVRGLSDYADGDYEAAMERFATADGIEGWEEDEGKEIVHLFLGNAAGRLAEYADAESHYMNALEIRPDYSRALVGIAETSFQQGRGDCGTTFDPNGLNHAISEYSDALQAEFVPPFADIEIKVAYGLGRVYLCQQIAGLQAPDPVVEFTTVIASADAGNRRVEELAWESHANLGLFYLAVQPIDLDRAVVEYQLAIARIDDSVGAKTGRQDLNERKAIFYLNMADALFKAGDKEGALSAYESAIELTKDKTTLEKLHTELAEISEEETP